MSFSCEVVFGEKMTLSVSPGFQKAKMEKRTGQPSPLNSVFWNIGRQVEAFLNSDQHKFQF